MITLIEALNWRCLRYLSQPLASFHLLVGPNASGKTTFLDVVGFLGDIVSEGLDTAITNRTTNPQELLFRRQGDSFELAIEAQIPERQRRLTARPELDTVRYEVEIGFDDTQRQFAFKAEKLLLKKASSAEERQEPQKLQWTLFPSPSLPPPSIITTRAGPEMRMVLNKVPDGNDIFYNETSDRSGSGAGKKWDPSFKLGPQKSALGNLPADEDSLPVATWFRHYLSSGVQRFILNSLAIKRPSPPTKVKGFLPDGSNLPWVVARFRKENNARYRDWINHLQIALPDLVDISTVEREEDRHCYLVYQYNNKLNVPSWLVSDGTLRLTALTLPAYLNDLHGIYLIEEPENGIHPRAISTVYDSLSSVYEAQVLLASHSPVMLNEAEKDKVLCFAKNEDGATDIVLGSNHPKLRQWQGEVSLGTLLASGVLG